MADLQYTCDPHGEGQAEFTWSWTSVPSDTSGPGKDGYFVRVVNVETSMELIGVPGAEDNAHGEPYTIVVPTDTELYVQVINEAESFHFEDDEIVTCPSTEIGTALTITELPYTGVADVLLPLAIVLTALGAGIVRLAKRVA